MQHNQDLHRRGVISQLNSLLISMISMAAVPATVF